jgi:hypothetical protein
LWIQAAYYDPENDQENASDEFPAEGFTEPGYAKEYSDEGIRSTQNGGGVCPNKLHQPIIERAAYDEVGNSRCCQPDIILPGKSGNAADLASDDENKQEEDT